MNGNRIGTSARSVSAAKLITAIYGGESQVCIFVDNIPELIYNILILFPEVLQ